MRRRAVDPALGPATIWSAAVPSADRKDLADLAARRGQIYAFWSADERPRLSLAGAQNKCPVLVRDGNYFLPQGEAPSSHILKFELADYRHLPAYETFTTQLAAAIGLPVVSADRNPRLFAADPVEAILAVGAP